jgi:hypothetical protein
VSVSDRIRALEAMLEQESEPEATPAVEEDGEPLPGPPETEEDLADEEEAGISILPVVVMGVGAAVIGGGVFFGLKAKKGEDDYAAAPVSTTADALAAEALIADAESDAVTANVLFAVGGAAFAAGAVWLTFELGLWDGSGAEASAWIDRDVTGVRVSGTWGAASW